MTDIDRRVAWWCKCAALIRKAMESFVQRRQLQYLLLDVLVRVIILVLHFLHLQGENKVRCERHGGALSMLCKVERSHALNNLLRVSQSQ